MTDLERWYLIALLVALVVLGWAALRRYRRVRYGYARHLAERGSVLRRYRRMRDGRRYDPQRNADIAPLLEPERDPST